MGRLGRGRQGDKGSAARGPELRRARARGASGSVLGLLLAGRPQLLAGLGLLDADRRRLADEQLGSLAGGDVLAQLLEATRLAEAHHELVGIRIVSLSGGPQRLE